MKNVKKLDSLMEFKTKEAMNVNGGGCVYQSCDLFGCKWTQCLNGKSYQIWDGKIKEVDCD